MTKAAAPNFLNGDGSASMATALMMSHHGLRRDLAQFALALTRVANGDRARVAALQEEWRNYHLTLHGHHEAEDQRMFPHMRAEHPELAQIIDGLGADHRRIDPLLERGDRAFAALERDAGEAIEIVAELSALLEPHLATEETHIIPLIRGANSFPPPANEEEARMYAEGFAWSSHGVAPDVLERVYAMLPAELAAKLPAARAAFEQRCERVWGSAKAGASRTPIPEWLRTRS
jgi:hemerythrin-like domain-containing protein